MSIVLDFSELDVNLRHTVAGPGDLGEEYDDPYEYDDDDIWDEDDDGYWDDDHDPYEGG